MQECIICRKTIPSNQEVCDEHRKILNSVSKFYDQDPEMHRRWNSVVELVKTKDYQATLNEDIEAVFKFIDEINREFERKL